MSITRRLGQQLYDALYIGKSVTISFAPSTTPQNAFENLASYSSQVGVLAACCMKAFFGGCRQEGGREGGGDGSSTPRMKACSQ